MQQTQATQLQSPQQTETYCSSIISFKFAPLQFQRFAIDQTETCTRHIINAFSVTVWSYNATSQMLHSKGHAQNTGKSYRDIFLISLHCSKYNNFSSINLKPARCTSTIYILSIYEGTMVQFMGFIAKCRAQSAIRIR